MFKQYALTYSFEALEPHIDTLTMETHYTKHHAAYTKNLNAAVEKAALDKNIEDLLSSLNQVEDQALRTAMRNNGGGFYNHNLYFATMGPGGGGRPSQGFLKKLEEEFGSFEAFKEKLSALALGQFGSGWAWLSVNRGGQLKLSSTPNQDNPLMEGKGFVPILGIDVWEHAYYLKYKNLRGDYVNEFFNVVLWDEVEKLYKKYTD